MTSQIGVDGSKSVRRIVMSSMEKDILWHQRDESVEQSFAGMIQLYSDKSTTSLKEPGFQFHPLHIVFLNFSEAYRRNCIVSGQTTLAFLPVKYYILEHGDKIEKGVSRAQKLRMIHHCISIALKELKEHGLGGVSCQDNHGTKWKCHLCISSYCCDLPESKDLTSVKNGNSSMRNCHRCLAKTENFNRYTTEEKRNGENTVTLITTAVQLRNNGKMKQAEQKLHEYLLIEQIPVLFNFPFIGGHKTLDMHALFAYEPLHNLHLGVSKELNTCLSERLKSTTLHSSAVPTGCKTNY